MAASLKGMLEVVQCLVEERRVDVHAKDEQGKDVAAWCARGGHVEVMRYLVEEVGMEVRAKYTRWPFDVLQLAVLNGHVELVKWLVEEKGMPTWIPYPDGHYLLDLASWGGHSAMVKFLTNVGGW